jgi:hypothetical protein
MQCVVLDCHKSYCASGVHKIYLGRGRSVCWFEPWNARTSLQKVWYFHVIEASNTRWRGLARLDASISQLRMKELWLPF